VPDAPQTLTIHIISDSVGDSAATIATAAASQFAHWECGIERLPNVARIEHIATYVEQQLEAQEQAQTPGRGASDGELVVFYTSADPDLCLQFERYIKDKNILAVDLIGPAIGAIAEATGETPLGTSGLIRRTDKDYFDRVAAMEFAVDHDDGRNPEELTSADIVLIGSSRTSKTPLSIYLAVHGYCVANVPLTPGSAPPPQLFEVEPRRIFGLTSKADLLSEIRFRRLGKAVEAAASYADPASVQSDLDEARALMRRLGCIVVRTDNRAIEETAQEILRYYETVTPRTNPQ
jgi:regulator of PEP synthase PpsR (kinase-PPPase family)